MINISRIIKKMRCLYSSYVIKLIFVNWFNPFYTLYFNFIFFPFKQAWHFPLFVYGWPKLYYQMGKMECCDICKMGMIRFNVTIPFGPQASLSSTQISVFDNGLIKFHGSCEIGTGNKINVGENAVLEIGRHAKIASLCNITSYSWIVIGDYTRIAHRCQVMDTNFHFIANFNKMIIPNLMRPINIGDYCWICNSSTISAGVKIPNKIIVASNSLVNKDLSDIPEESIIGGAPAKLLATGFRRVENPKLSGELWNKYVIDKDAKIYKLGIDVPHSICDADYN